MRRCESFLARKWCGRSCGVVERCPLTMIITEESRPGDHGGVVSSESWGRCEHLDVDAHPSAHRLDQRAIARDAAAEHYPVAMKHRGGTRGFLDQRLDQRILKSTCDIGAIALDVGRTSYRVEHGGLESAE